jgi:hypothetical protein
MFASEKTRNRGSTPSDTFRHVMDAGLDVIAVQQAIEADLEHALLLDGLNKVNLELSGLMLRLSRMFGI